MKLNLISLETVKAELGLSVTTNDDAISAMIPKVSADVRRILNTNYDKEHYAYFDTETATISLGNYANNLSTSWPMGQVLESVNLPDDTYITGGDVNTGVYTLSATPTDEGDYVYPTVNISQWSAISKMIWYRISKLATNDINDKAVASESFGKISKTYSASEVNKRWNYPQALIDDLGSPFVKVG